MNISEVLASVQEKTGEDARRIAISVVPFNASIFSGGVTARVSASLVGWNVRWTPQMMGIDMSKLSDRSKSLWNSFRANYPMMRLIHKSFGRGPERQVNVLRGTLQTWSFNTRIGALLSGHFIPFSAYPNFLAAAEKAIRIFQKEVEDTVKNRNWWFEQSKPYLVSWCDEVINAKGLNVDPKRLIAQLQDMLPSSEQIMRSTLDYGITYVTSSPEAASDGSVATAFERDVLEKLFTLIYQDILDPLYKAVATGKGKVTEARADRVRSLVKRVRTLNIMDNDEVGKLADSIGEMVKRKQIDSAQFERKLQDLASVCRDDLIRIGAEVPELANLPLEEDLPQAIGEVRDRLELGDLPDLPEVTIGQPVLEVAA